MAKIPATVITGFLGAGKTTLIRHLISQAQGRRLALIINEFGDLGIDGEILRACGNENCGEEDIVELANGCICCTVADDFLPTMEALLARPERPDHIIIETSGLALPKPLIKAFNWPAVRTQVTVDGVLALVDGAALAEGLLVSDAEALQQQRQADPELDHESPIEELFEEQLGAADMVIINKADLMDTAQRQSASEQITSYLRPGVGVVHSAHGGVQPEILLGLQAAAEDDLASRPSHHDDDSDHEHDDFESFVITLPEITDLDSLVTRLRRTITAHEILRVKGFLQVQNRDMRAVLQAVGQRIGHYFDRDWGPDEARQSRLVIIGHHGLDRAAIEAQLMA